MRQSIWDLCILIVPLGKYADNDYAEQEEFGSEQMMNRFNLAKYAVASVEMYA
jgi:hypothetical protein